MNIQESLRLMKEYETCKECGNTYIGNGEGRLEIAENMFIRSCKCGWKVEVNLKWVNGK